MFFGDVMTVGLLENKSFFTETLNLVVHSSGTPPSLNIHEPLPYACIIN